MELEITKSEFEKVVYVATSSNSAVYDAVLPYIENEYERMETILMTEGITVMGTNALLKKHVKAYLCELGFIKAIRHLTLTLTSAGFGVVSNDHVAPASSDKIQELEKALWRALDRDYCVILGILMSVSGWGAKAKALVPFIVWNIFDVQDMCGKPELDHESWVKLKRSIYDAQFKISEAISFEQVEELCKAMRCNNATDAQKEAIALLQQSVCDIVCAQDDFKKVGKYLERVINFFENKLTTFTTYKNSSEYKARHTERYANTKDSSAFFFG